MCPTHVVASSWYTRALPSSALQLKLSPTVLFNERHIYEQSNDPRKNFIEGHKNIHDYLPNNAAFHCKSPVFLPPPPFFFLGGVLILFPPPLCKDAPHTVSRLFSLLLKTLIAQNRTRCACAPQTPQLLSSLTMRQRCKRWQKPLLLLG